MVQYQNPVIRGYHPDPSICRVGGDYYLVTSTFEFFPGVPIFHSKNLVDWELINYCLKTDSQLPLDGCGCSQGIFAPTIRYHEGIFYMITTNLSDRGNFVVHTEDIYGAWSEPHWIDQKGIDPSLLFDDDGKVYFCGTDNSNPCQGIVVFEINPKTGERLSEKKVVTFGTGGKYPEAPHLYKIKGMYYLMLAEGGTEYGHMETIFRSSSPYGPFEPCPHNPILTHRERSDSPIQATGHADMIEDQNGNWWMVCLGIRPLRSNMLHHIGRETFLTPMKWDGDGWPVIGNGGGIALTMEGELPGEAPVGNSWEFEEDFSSEVLNLRWNFVRNPKWERYSLKNGKLCMFAKEEDLSSMNPTFAGIVQPEHVVCARTKLSAKLHGACSKAGITAFYNKDYYYALYLTRREGGLWLELSHRIHGVNYMVGQKELPEMEQIELQIEAGDQEYWFSYFNGIKWEQIGNAKTAGLCTEGMMQMTFTGTYLGIFASDAEAEFDYFCLTQ